MKLKGITWNHTRGYLPMAATAQRYCELHPGVEITWEKRSLQEFGDYPIEKLAEEFDLVVIDHPFVGYAHAHGTLLALDEYLPQGFLFDQSKQSVGKSYESYLYGAHLWALPIDAAAPVSSSRPDLLEKRGWGLPETWDDLIKLARAGLVILPAIPIDSLMHFFMLCCAFGEDPFSKERVVNEDLGVLALKHLRELVCLCSSECLGYNPIKVYEVLTTGDTALFCPFAYGYSNYARPHYARHILHFDVLPKIHGQRLRSTLGGTGLAISRKCGHTELAISYAQYAASPESQMGLYLTSGGQPAYRLAWEDPGIDAACNGFFSSTLSTLDEAYLRPRYDGYLHFQEKGGREVHKYLREGGDPRTTLNRMEELRLESLSTVVSGIF